MNFDEFHKQLADAPISFRRKLRDYLRHPTERMACYITGYVAALEDARLFKTDNAASYWFILIGRVEGNGALGCDLIAEMDSLPADDVQAAEIEALRESLAALKAENEKLREALRAEVLEALGRARQTAMEQTLKARIPECGEFAGIAQDLGFVVVALRQRLGDSYQIADTAWDMRTGASA